MVEDTEMLNDIISKEINAIHLDMDGDQAYLLQEYEQILREVNEFMTTRLKEEIYASCELAYERESTLEDIHTSQLNLCNDEATKDEIQPCPHCGTAFVYQIINQKGLKPRQVRLACEHQGCLDLIVTLPSLQTQKLNL